MPILAGMVTSGGGRFVPPLTVARAGLGLAAGQFKITDANYAQLNYTPGGQASVAGNIISLPNAPTGPASSGTVQAVAPKGIMTSAVVNVARTPYTYHNSHHHNPKCASHWHGGQCAQWGPPNHGYNSSPLDGTPSGYVSSENEWWRIW
jgi:hypothetical protein